MPLLMESEKDVAACVGALSSGVACPIFQACRPGGMPAGGMSDEQHQFGKPQNLCRGPLFDILPWYSTRLKVQNVKYV